MLTARSIMTEGVVSIQPSATVEEAAQVLLKNRISGMPVVDNGKLVGIITEFALLAVAYDENLRFDKVEQHMTTEVLTVGPDVSIKEVVDLCIVHRVRRVPVVQDDRILGLIARCDVLKSVYESKTLVSSP